jgi:hypothetical protein
MSVKKCFTDSRRTSLNRCPIVVDQCDTVARAGSTFTPPAHFGTKLARLLLHTSYPLDRRSLKLRPNWPEESFPMSSASHRFRMNRLCIMDVGLFPGRFSEFSNVS